MNLFRTLVCAAMLAATVAPAWAAVSREAAAARRWMLSRSREAVSSSATACCNRSAAPAA